MNTNLKAVAAGIGCAVIVAAGCAASLMGGQVAAEITASQRPTPTVTATLPQATITTQLPRATTTVTATPPPKVVTVTKRVPSATITCGRTESDCYPDYLGKGRWVIREGERPMPKATKSIERSVPKATTKRVPRATIEGVCRHPRITKAMVADCNKLARLPKVIDAQGNETPEGRVLVRECLDSYLNPTELKICLAP